MLKKPGNEDLALFKALPDFMFVLSRDGRFIDYHTPDPSLLFLPPQKFLGKHFKKVLPKDLAEKLETLFDRVLESGRIECLEHTLIVSGKVCYFEARIVPYGPDKILFIVRDITDRKQLEEVLRENQERYQQIVDHAPIGIWEIDYWKQKVVRVNDILCDYLGYSREEILSGNPMEFLTEEGQILFAERLQKILANELVPRVFELEIKTKKGSKIWALVNTRPIYEEGKLRGAFVVAQDITALKSAEKALKESEGHLRSLMENARNFAIYRLAYDDKKPYGVSVVFAGPSLDEILGTSDRMKFETWFENIHPDDRERVKKAQIRASKTFKFDETMQIYHPRKKEWRWIQATANGILDQKGRPTYVNGIITDITEKKRAEEALQKAHDHLEQRVKQRTLQLSKTNKELKKEIEERKQAERALEKSEKKFRVLSTRLINAQENERKRIAIELHDELGQSLIGLKFQLSNLAKKFKENQEGLRPDVDQALHTIDRMTEDVRRLSRDLRPSVLEHLGLFEALQWLLGEYSKQYPFKIISTIQEPDFSFSKGQEIIIFRIFQEALTNIGKHAQARQVLIDMKERGEEVVFSIKDNGKGFDFPEVISSTLPERGLGLTAMDERARMAGGALNILSRKGKGTKITFTVPLKKGKKTMKIN